MGERMREARIFPGHISHNVEALHRAAGTAEAMLVVKADGYGHGLVTAAKAGLDGGATWLGTADIDEALALRRSGITAPVLAWLIGPDSEVSEAIQHGVTLGVGSVDALRQVIAEGSVSAPAIIHIEVDTGMGRGGIEEKAWEEVFHLAHQAEATGSIQIQGMFTHFAQTSGDSDARQQQAFDRAREQAQEVGLDPEVIHTSSSTPAVRSSQAGNTLVRLGMSAYGVGLVPEHEPLRLRPAMRVSGQVIQVKHLPANHGVGYDHTYRTHSDTTVVVVPMGYADGLPRLASSAGPVTINGQRFSVSGRVSMDQVSIDVGSAAVSRGDWAVFFGDPDNGEPGVWDWAKAASTIPYEMVTGIGARVERVIG
jgi:alanine racemase